MSRWSDEQDRGSFVFCATLCRNHHPIRRGRLPVSARINTMVVGGRADTGVCPYSRMFPLPTGEGRGGAPNSWMFSLPL